MNAYLLPGLLGLLIGLMLHWAGFSRSEGLRHALGLRAGLTLRSGLTAVGWSMALTALMCWLAVIDVDSIEVLPLSLGALLGGALLGIAGGLCGFTPSTAFAGLGAGNALEALCVLAGCGAMTLLLPALDGLLSPLRTASPYAAATLFQVTLDEPFLLGGGFLGQGCAGAVLIAAGAAIFTRNAKGPSPEPSVAPEPLPAAEPEAAPAEPSSTPDDPSSDTPSTPDPEDAPEDAFVALLPEEEPLVVDTALDEAPSPEPDEEPPSPVEPEEASSSEPASKEH